MYDRFNIGEATLEITAVISSEPDRLSAGPTLGPRCVLQGDRSCSGREPCAAHDLWSEVGERYTSFLEKTTSFPENINIEVTQTYTSPADAPAGGAGRGGRGAAGNFARPTPRGQ